jgi:hypothetical protein
MNDLYRIVLTSCFTIMGGLVVLVGGQIMERWFIEPVHAVRMAVGRIRHSVLYYANIYMNPGTARPDLLDAASSALRTHAAELGAAADAVPWYGLFSFLRAVPRRKAVDDAVKALIGLSNTVYSGSPDDARGYRDIITRALG